MGLYTHFSGTLKFTRRLTESELETVAAILRAGETRATPEIEAILDREHKERQIPGRAILFDTVRETRRRAELKGYIAPKGCRRKIEMTPGVQSRNDTPVGGGATTQPMRRG